MVSQVPFLPGKLFACSTINKAITNYGIPRDWISLNSDSITFYGIPGAMFFPGKLFACSTNFLFPYILTARHYRGEERDFFSFFQKSQNFRAPLCNFQFFKIVLRTYLQIFRPIRPTVFEKIDIFCQKMAISKYAFFGQNLNTR